MKQTGKTQVRGAVAASMEPFKTLDWDNMEAVNTVSDRALRHLASPGILGGLFRELYHDDHLLGLCEHFDHFDKLVLHDSADDHVRLRMHIFGAKYIEEAHNHRHCFSSLILSGEYIHYIYGSEDDRKETDRHGVSVPILAQRQPTGSCYSLHHSAIHSNYAEPETVSLVIAGPPRREYFRIVDTKTNESRVRYSAKKKPGLQEKGEARISGADLDRLAPILEQRGVI